MPAPGAGPADLFRPRLERATGRILPAAASERAPVGRLRDDAPDPGGERGGIAWWNEPPSLAPRADDTARRADFGGEHRQPLRHRVEPRLAVALGVRRMYALVGRPQLERERGPIELSRKPDRRAKAELAHARLDLRTRRAVPGQSDQREGSEPFLPQDPERLQQHRHAFLDAQAAGVDEPGRRREPAV